jgi:uncharacterized protein YceK
MGIWDGVTVVTVSDFGRTLTSNGLGTDHAWGGNHFIIVRLRYSCIVHTLMLPAACY